MLADLSEIDPEPKDLKDPKVQGLVGSERWATICASLGEVHCQTVLSKGKVKDMPDFAQ
jgi:hypothetical protein